MLREMLLGKIHRANVTFRDLNYIGSITIDKLLLDATGINPDEKVDIYNISNGNRFATYVIEGETGTGVVGINGAAARLVSIGDKVIIAAYGLLTPEEIKDHKAEVVVINDSKNLEFKKLS